MISHLGGNAVVVAVIAVDGRGTTTAASCCAGLERNRAAVLARQLRRGGEGARGVSLRLDCPRHRIVALNGLELPRCEKSQITVSFN